MTTIDVGSARTLVRPNLVLAICCMSLLVVAMDATIVNVALPSIRRDLSASTTGLQWVVDAYTLVVASLLMLSGSLADRFGRRRTFQVGMAIFTLASVLCSLAPNLSWLIAFRMLQALGGSMLNPVAMSIITNTFIEPKARARAIGVWGAVVGVSMALGPLVGGALTQASIRSTDPVLRKRVIRRHRRADEAKNGSHVGRADRRVGSERAVGGGVCRG